MELEKIIGNNEKILWRGKPSRKCFMLESIFNPMLPFALIWAAFDSIFIIASIMSGEPGMIGFMSIFMLIHLMPVWIYLGGVLLAKRRYQNTEYVITDRGIYVSGGTFNYSYEMKPLTEVSHVKIDRGIFDQKLGVGDVTSVCTHGAHEEGITIHDISDYMEVFNLIKKLHTDIYSDTMFPNDMRPQGNHGYNTKYTMDK